MIDAQLFTAFIVAATILILMPGPMSERSAAVHARTLEHGRTAPSLKCGLSGLLASGALHTNCDRPTDIGKKAFVPYTADYIFYKR